MGGIELSDLLRSFFDEAKDHLASIEHSLLALVDAPEDAELLNQIFRGAHSIKGASAICGLDDVRRLTHALEGLLQKLRAGELALTPVLSSTLFRATDVLAATVGAAQQGVAAPAEVASLIDELGQAAGGIEPEPASDAPTWALFDDEPAPVAEGAAHASLAGSAGARRYRVHFTPERSLLQQGLDPLLPLSELAALGELLEVSVDSSALPPLADLDPGLCYLSWTLTLRTEQAEERLLDVFAFVEEYCRIGIDCLGEEPAETAALEPAAPEPEQPASPPRVTKLDQPGDRPAAQLAISSVRVDTAKIDRLVDLVGELVIAHSMIASAAEDASSAGASRLRDAIAVAERGIAELQYRALSVRMLPVGSVFARIPRLVHDTASLLGKRVELVLEGKEIEIDKELIEKLSDPLLHLVRNAVDHGIEAPAEREQRGKPAIGSLRVQALQHGSQFLVEVSDDGAGLPTEKIRDKARALGLVPAAAEPSDDELHALIFAPGFSTAQQVSEVSGRGVGMDVVKRNIEALNGTISFSSERGRGSRFQLRLPLTLGIIEGMLLRVGQQVFVVPLTAVVESLRPTRQQLRNVLGRGELVCIRDQALPLLRLHRAFAIPDAERNPCQAALCVVEAEHRSLALLVDELVAQVRVVVKPLEKNFRRVSGVMGATILGDGRVALILDVPALLRMASRNVSQQELSNDAS
jgi:two-component system, chemotaxis family, sensor kinase CheA